MSAMTQREEATTTSVLNDPNVFPLSKIRAQLRRHPSFGRVIETTSQTVRVASVLLIQGLVDDIVNETQLSSSSSSQQPSGKNAESSASEKRQTLINLEDVQDYLRRHSKDYHFVSGRVHKLTESDAKTAFEKSVKQQRKRKHNAKEAGQDLCLSAPLQDIAALAQKQNAEMPERDLIEPDDDDYD